MSDEFFGVTLGSFFPTLERDYEFQARPLENETYGGVEPEPAPDRLLSNIHSAISTDVASANSYTLRVNPKDSVRIGRGARAAGLIGASILAAAPLLTPIPAFGSSITRPMTTMTIMAKSSHSERSSVRPRAHHGTGFVVALGSINRQFVANEEFGALKYPDMMTAECLSRVLGELANDAPDQVSEYVAALIANEATPESHLFVALSVAEGLNLTEQRSRSGLRAALQSRIPALARRIDESPRHELQSEMFWCAVRYCASLMSPNDVKYLLPLMQVQDVQSRGAVLQAIYHVLSTSADVGLKVRTAACDALRVVGRKAAGLARVHPNGEHRAYLLDALLALAVVGDEDGFFSVVSAGGATTFRILRRQLLAQVDETLSRWRTVKVGRAAGLAAISDRLHAV